MKVQVFVPEVDFVALDPRRSFQVDEFAKLVAVVTHADGVLVTIDIPHGMVLAHPLVPVIQP